MSSPKLPSSPSLTQSGVASRELEELGVILGDAAALAALAADASARAALLEETATLERLAELSSRLLLRNKARAAARAICMLAESAAHADRIDAATACITPAYFRRSEGYDEGQTVWASKVFLHGVPGAPGTTLCVRFSLTESRPADDDAEPTYDLALKAMQVAPFEVAEGGHRFTLSFGLQDASAERAAAFTLDDVQRAKLLELKGLLGFASGRWTAVGVLALLLAAAGCAAVEDNACFAGVLRAAREAHREELLANAGNLF